jgi:hypothetical protein
VSRIYDIKELGSPRKRSIAHLMESEPKSPSGVHTALISNEVGKRFASRTPAMRTGAAQIADFTAASTQS